MSLIGNMLSLPYMLLFFAAWLFASLLSPVILACLVLAFTKPFAAIRKLQLLVTTIQYLLLCNDKSNWKVPKEDPQLFFADLSKADEKVVIFVRHGESTWNDTFNRGDRSKLSFLLYFLPNLVKALYYEISFFVSGQQNESWFFDSPLSEKGLQQACGVKSFLQDLKLEYETPRQQELLQIMLGNHASKKSQLVSSNLRRAISTMAIGFQQRLVGEVLDGNACASAKSSSSSSSSSTTTTTTTASVPESMMILPQLQEMSRNPDALCITPAHDKVKVSWTDPKEIHKIYDERLDMKFHTGNKPVDSNGLERMQDFCRIVFEEMKDVDAIVAAGHSLYFRNFFQTYLPRTVEHVSKKKKLKNGACVGFTLLRIPNDEKSYHYMIDPKSIAILYGGF